MHPNPAFRHDDKSLLSALINEIGFGMVFATTPDGPRVAHTPLQWTGAKNTGGALHFHLARGNALTPHLDGMTALAMVNGPESYVSPRWYADQAQVPTWNYLAVEVEGPVRRLDDDGLIGLLEALIARQEAEITAGEPWSMAKIPEAKLRGLLTGIVGFAMEVQDWRPTFKLSQNKSAQERALVAAGLEAQGAGAIAELMRVLAP